MEKNMENEREATIICHGLEVDTKILHDLTGLLYNKFPRHQVFRF